MKEKVSVTGVPETMIQTLYARAKESGKKMSMYSPFCVHHIKEKSILSCAWKNPCSKEYLK